MHKEAYDFVSTNIPPANTVLEIGSININGEVRQLLPDADWYGIDIIPGKGVDEVADGATFQPPEPVDLAISCEVMEHTPKWREIVANMVSMVKPGGHVLITCAALNREPHSANGMAMKPGEFYKNINPIALQQELLKAGVASVKMREDVHQKDVYVLAQV